MPRAVLTDTGVLGALTHPKTYTETRTWLKQLLEAGYHVFIPEIADYELRRELLQRNDSEGVRRLNDLKSSLGYICITTEAILWAAALWAQARKGGYTTAGDQALDGGCPLGGLSWRHKPVRSRGRASRSWLRRRTSAISSDLSQHGDGKT